MYPLNLYTLNNFLRGLQMEPVTSTHDKTLVTRIIDNYKKLDQSSSDPKVINALRYYKCLAKRTRDTMPKSYQPKPLAYKCPHCIKTFSTQDALQTHVRVHNVSRRKLLLLYTFALICKYVSGYSKGSLRYLRLLVSTKRAGCSSERP